MLLSYPALHISSPKIPLSHLALAYSNSCTHIHTYHTQTWAHRHLWQGCHMKIWEGRTPVLSPPVSWDKTLISAGTLVNTPIPQSLISSSEYITKSLPPSVFILPWWKMVLFGCFDASTLQAISRVSSYTIQYGSHYSPHIAVEQLIFGWCGWRTKF